MRQGQGRGVDDIEFTGVFKKSHAEFPGEPKKNSCEISRGLGFWP